MCATSAPTPGCPRASVPRASPVGSSRRAIPTSGSSCATPSSPSARRASPTPATPAAPVLRQPGALSRSTPCASCSPTPAAPTPPPAGAGSTTPPRPRARRRSPSGVRARARSLLGSTGGISHYLPVDDDAARHPRRRVAAAPRGRRRLPAGDPDDRRVREARQPRGRAALRHGAPQRAVQGRRDDLAALRHDALLRPDRRRARGPRRPSCCSGVCVKRSFDRCTVDGQLSTNDTAVLMCSGASGVSVAPESEDELRFGEALDALLRQLAILMVADGEGARRIGRVRRARGASRRVEAAARAVANSPLVKTALHGGDPNWGRIVQAVGGALGGRGPVRAPLAMDISIEGTQVCSASAAIPYDEPALAEPLQAQGDRVRDHACRARAPRPRSSSPTSPTSTSRSTPTTRREPRVPRPSTSHRPSATPCSAADRPTAPAVADAQHPSEVHLMRDVGTLLEALPYIREFHGKTVVIKYGGAAMEDPELREEFARDVVLLKYVGLNPIVVHGGGPDITAYMERLGLPVEFVGGLRVSDADTVEVAKMVLVGKVNKEIVLRLSRHGQPAVGLCGDDGSLFRVARRAAPGGEDIGFVGRIERVNVDVLEPRRARLHPGDRLGRRRPRGRLLQRQRRRGRRRRRRRARRLQDRLPHRRPRLARRPAGPRQPDRPGHRRAGRTRLCPSSQGGMRPKLAACRRGDRRRRQLRPHHRRAHPALAAARALHRRRDRHQDRESPA